MVQTTAARSPLTVSARVTAFVADAQKDAVVRYADKLGPVSHVTPEAVADWAAAHDIAQIVAPYIPTGPTRDALKDVRLCQIIRPYDSAAWPHATHGFFRFKDKIPALLGDMKGLRLA